MFERTISLVGKSNFEKIQEKTVLIVGLGGVGGYATESLVRTGIKNLILIIPSVFLSLYFFKINLYLIYIIYLLN